MGPLAPRHGCSHAQQKLGGIVRARRAEWGEGAGKQKNSAAALVVFFHIRICPRGSKTVPATQRLSEKEITRASQVNDNQGTGAAIARKKYCAVTPKSHGRRWEGYCQDSASPSQSLHSSCNSSYGWERKGCAGPHLSHSPPPLRHANHPPPVCH